MTQINSLGVAKSPETTRVVVAMSGGVDSSPVIAGDRVLFGSQDGRITMLRFDTGEKIWSYLVGSPVRAAVAVVDGWIIAVAVDGGVYAFGEAP